MDSLALLNLIDEDIKKYDIRKNYISSVLNIDKSSLTQYLSGRYRMPFYVFLTIIQIVYKDKPLRQKALLEIFIEKMDKPRCIIDALSYFSANYTPDFIKILLNKCTTLNNKQIKEFGIVYDVLFKRKQKKIETNIFINKILDLQGKTRIDELKLLLEISVAYYFLDVQEYKSLIKLSEDILIRIDNLASTKTKYIVKIRAIEMLLVANLFLNEVDNFKKIYSLLPSKEICFEFCPAIYANIKNCYAQILLKENHLKSIKMLEESRDLVLKNNDIFEIDDKFKVISDTLDFVKIFSNYNLQEQNPSSLAEKAHLYAKIGKKKEAMEILKDIKRKQGELTAFQDYYLYLCTGDLNDLSRALLKLEMAGNNFYYELFKNNH